MKLKTVVLLSLIICSGVSADQVVGQSTNGGIIVPTKQLIRPAGKLIEYNGFSIDLALSPDGKTLYVKTAKDIQVIDVESWKVRQLYGTKIGALNFHGLAITRDGTKLYVTTAGNAMLEVLVNADGSLSPGRTIDLPGPDNKSKSISCGIALSPDEKTAYVCLSRNNTLGVVDLVSGKLASEIPVGVVPYDVALSADGGVAWVSNWGGRRPVEGEKTEISSGTPTLVDSRSIPCSGTVSFVDIGQGRESGQVVTGLHPCDLELNASGSLLYVANANSDSVTVIDTSTRSVTRTIDVKPVASLPFGSAPNALALAKDGKSLFVANGGNNAVAVVSGKLRGLVPTGWYPGAIATDGKYLYIANVKGYGARSKREEPGWIVYQALGTVQKVEIPSEKALKAYTKQVLADARVPQTLRAIEKAQSGVKPVAIPQRPGEPSLMEHVVYIIKENKTYDQVYGDMGRGNSDPQFCTFGREITPNHHDLADRFALLDNYYCNCVQSADGHQWVTQGYATDYAEKSLGGWPRSYPYEGNDPMIYSSAGFIWDNVLLHGLSFRNYGEMSTNGPSEKASFKEIYQDHLDKTGKFKFSGTFNIETLRRYSCPDYPGWSLGMPDQVRADVFLKEFAEFEKTGDLPNLMTVLLPNDHTAGTKPGVPTPRAFVADNDLAVGRIVEAISKSKFWSTTCIFIIEDDPQSGVDHVDGHRSICLVISPYTKRGALVSQFYNQTSVLHTMELILGIPPMNQMDAMAPVMRECFTDKPDLAPYTAIPSNVPLDEVTPPLSQLSGSALYWAQKSAELPFDRVDEADNDTLNRILWHAMKGYDNPYPAEFAGAHGKGLAALHLALALDEDEYGE